MATALKDEVLQPADILIIWASYGQGHRRAAEALEAAFHHLRPDLSVQLADYNLISNAKFHQVVTKAYLQTVQTMPAVYDYYYRLLARMNDRSLVYQSINHIGLKHMERAIQAVAPRVVISVFPTSSGTVGELKRYGLMAAPLVTVITDNVVHSQWLHSYTDLYLVGSEQVRRGLLAMGVAPERVKATGIPIDPRFSRLPDRRKARAALGLSQEAPVVLVLGGAARKGSGVDAVASALLQVGQPLQALLVAGDGTAVEEVSGLLQREAGGLPAGWRILPHLDDPCTAMAAADLLVSKAGGLTVSEALASGLPMVLFGFLPGQEEANVRYVEQAGAGIAVSDVLSLRAVLARLLGSPGVREEMARRAIRAGRPNSAFQAATAVIEAFFTEPRRLPVRVGERREARESALAPAVAGAVQRRVPLVRFFRRSGGTQTGFRLLPGGRHLRWLGILLARQHARRRWIRSGLRGRPRR